MALFFPSYEDILSNEISNAEKKLLNFLHMTLDENYEVYFQPFLNGDRPNVIVMRKDYGVLIIEIKDWKTNDIKILPSKKWIVNRQYIKSPIDQVLKYKENFYNLHIKKLLELKIKNPRYWSIVSCAVYFHNVSSSTLEGLFLDTKDKKFTTRNQNVIFLTKNILNTTDFFNSIEKSALLNELNMKFFNNSMYLNFKRYLQPPLVKRKKENLLQYTAKQKELMVSSVREQRVRGVVGSGKTTVIAERAVNSFNRTNERVLILCYNITLKNYIVDKIKKVCENYNEVNFYVTNYHDFMSKEMNNNGIEILVPRGFVDYTPEMKNMYFEDTYYSNINLFKSYNSKFFKYKTILIDEIQDYKRTWMDVIKDNFLAIDGEYILFGDEKQNIYSNELDKKDIVTNVKQRPSVLNNSFRSNNTLKDIAINFQQKFFSEKYRIDKNIKQTSLFDKQCRVEYIFLEKEFDVTKMFDLIKNICDEIGDHPNDVSILGIQISILRELDCYFRYKTGENTNTMFETQEIWFKLLVDNFKGTDVFKEGLNLIGNCESENQQILRFTSLLILKYLEDGGSIEDYDIIDRYNYFITKYMIDKCQFENWYDSHEIKTLLNRDRKQSLRKLHYKYQNTHKKFLKSLKKVRDNKKYNFWNNSGTLKMSTILSFKGWETNTVFLLLEPHWKENGDFPYAFEELIYTGFTRSKQNLVIINLGNYKHHKSIESLIQEVV